MNHRLMYAGIQYVPLEDYEALQAECEKLQAAVAGLSNPETVLVNMLLGKIAIPDVRSWSKLFGTVLTDEDARLLEIARLRALLKVLAGALNAARDKLETVESRGHGERWTAREMWPSLFAQIDAALQEGPPCEQS